MDAWGWRVPFFIGCLILPFVFQIRRSPQETDEFLARTHHPSVRTIVRSIASNWPLVFAGTMLVIMTTVSFYLITVDTPTFGKAVLKLSAADSLIVTFCVGMSNFVWLPVMGALSDRVGRRLILAFFTVLTIATAYPVLAWLVTAPSFTHMLVTELWLSFLYASYNGAAIVALTEVMPPHVLARLQPGDGPVRRVHAACLDVAHRDYRRQGRSGLLDDDGGCLWPDGHRGALPRVRQSTVG